MHEKHVVVGFHNNENDYHHNNFKVWNIHLDIENSNKFCLPKSETNLNKFLDTYKGDYDHVHIIANDEQELKHYRNIAINHSENFKSINIHTVKLKEKLPSTDPSCAYKDVRLDEIVSVSSRYKKKIIMKRYRVKLQRMKKRVLRRIAPPQKIIQRAQKQGRLLMKNLLSDGNYRKLSYRERMNVDKAVAPREKFIKQHVKRLKIKSRVKDIQRVHKINK